MNAAEEQFARMLKAFSGALAMDLYHWNFLRAGKIASFMGQQFKIIIAFGCP